MKRVLALLRVVGTLPLFLPMHVYASPTLSSDVLIVELQTGSTVSASEEFIEIYNVSDQAIDISDWRIEYFSASATNFTSPSRTMPLHGSVAEGGRYLLASANYLTDVADETFTATLAKGGGHVRLVSPDSLHADQVIVHDLVGWGTAGYPEGTAAAPPSEGTSLQRKVDEQALYVDTDDNANDFAINTVPTPESNNPTPVEETPPDETPVNPPEESPTETPADNPPTDTSPQPEQPNETPTSTLLPLQISELLPNPAPPASDDTDEFVELYNPNSEPVDLSGYKLQTGNTYSYSYTFDDEELPAHSYQAWYVSETDLLLANSSGHARLINPSGQVIAETDQYEEADDGQSWALINSKWQWTLSSTPHAANTLSLPLLNAAAKKVASTTKKPTTKKTTKAKASTTKKTTKPKVAAASTSEPSDPKGLTKIVPVHLGVVVAVAVLALLYAGHEYRHDALNRIYQFRRYRATRRAARASLPGQ